MKRQFKTTMLLVLVLVLVIPGSAYADDEKPITEDAFIGLVKRYDIAMLAWAKQANKPATDPRVKRLNKRREKAFDALMKHVGPESHALNMKRYKSLTIRKSTFSAAKVLFGTKFKFFKEEYFGKGTVNEKVLRAYRWQEGEKMIELFFYNDKNDDHFGIVPILRIKKQKGLEEASQPKKPQG